MCGPGYREVNDSLAFEVAAGCRTLNPEETVDISFTTIREAVRHGFSLVFFPALAVGVFIYILVTVISQIHNAGDRIRRLTAALLPVVTLIFVLISTNHTTTQVSTAMAFTGKVGQLLIGAVLGAAAIFVGRFLNASKKEIGPTLHVLFISIAGSFLLYVAAIGALPSLNFYLFGCVLGGAVYVIARGWLWPPKDQPGKQTRQAPGGVQPQGTTDADRQNLPPIHPPSV